MAESNEILREQSQFRHSKSPILAKYFEDHTKMMAAIAARGFVKLPGYAYDAENMLELTAKLNLQEVNYKILAETIEREMKQAGINYDIAYKEESIAWEIDKDKLLKNWEMEYADLKKGMDLEEEALKQLSITVNLRRIVLLEQKTVIELQAEAYRLQLAQLNGSTAPYEVQLAQQKLATAQKKLTIIPILQEIVRKEYLLLAAEGQKAAAYSGVIAAHEQVANLKQSIQLPAVLALVSASESYSIELPVQISKELLISAEKVTQAASTGKIATSNKEHAKAELDYASKSIKLLEQRSAYNDARNTNESKLIGKSTGIKAALGLVETTANASILSDDKAAQTSWVDKKGTIMSYEQQTHSTSSLTNATNEENSAFFRGNLSANAIAQKANLEATAKLVADLTHLIG